MQDETVRDEDAVPWTAIRVRPRTIPSMFLFLLIVILLAILGVLGLALKIAAALLLGVMIAGATLVAVGYFVIRHQLRRAQASFGSQVPAKRSAHTTVEIGEPRREPDVDDRY
jgi:hypothetical protein